MYVKVWLCHSETLISKGTWFTLISFHCPIHLLSDTSHNKSLWSDVITNLNDSALFAHAITLQVYGTHRILEI